MHRITENILTSKKYRALYPKTVDRVVVDSCVKYGEERAEEEARSVLHQIWGSYYSTRPDFKKLWKKFQEEVAAGNREQAIDTVLRLHASSAERQPIFDDFYKKIFAITGVPSSIVDHGCCLDPVAFERMTARAAPSVIPLSSVIPGLTRNPSPGFSYQAFDIDTEEVEFLQKACKLLGYGESVKVAAGDAISGEPVPADVVFMLKLLPVLEQQRKGSARGVLMKQRCKWLVVSYPVASLSGKEKGMTEFYSKQFLELTADLNWRIERLLFATELVFVCRL
jgi:16S rRNA (guanine(1405)-N(7))-methyltransferase